MGAPLDDAALVHDHDAADAADREDPAEGDAAGRRLTNRFRRSIMMTGKIIPMGVLEVDGE